MRFAAALEWLPGYVIPPGAKATSVTLGGTQVKYRTNLGLARL
jgi:hypothetical protein